MHTSKLLNHNFIKMKSRPKTRKIGYQTIIDGVNIKEINSTRRSLGMKEIEYKERDCLRCGKKFISEGNFNRNCGCANFIEDYSDEDYNSSQK